MKYPIIIFFFFLSIQSFIGYGQTISNVKARKTSEKKFIVTYDLQGTEGSEHVVELYLTLDNAKTWHGPLQSVDGDIGTKQIPGNNKVIICELTEESVLKGTIQFKVEVRAPNVSYNNDAINSNTIQIDNSIIESTPWVFDAEYIKYKKKKNAWLVTGCVTTVGSPLFLWLAADEKSDWDEHESVYYGNGPTGSMEKRHKLFVSLGISSTAFAIISWVKVSKHSKKLKNIKSKYSLSAIPYKDGMQFGLTYNF